MAEPVNRLYVGARAALRKGLRRLLSRQAWIVLYRPLALDEPASAMKGVSFTEAFERQLAEVASALPDELAGDKTVAQRKSLVQARFRVSMPCILAQGVPTGEVMAGCWCRPVTNSSKLWAVLPEGACVFEISSLFTAPEFRGRKLGKAVIQQACHVMKQKDYTGCVSLVWYSRLPSIKAHLSYGFRPVGEKITWSVVGFRWSVVRKGSAGTLKSKLTRAGV